ncbi:hypothetical protein EXO80_22530 [Salmonella enterica]|nr:hypothetical protein [Salmonella enterica]ECH1725834.1 hypothetical protein [Salmonella enterica]
MPGRTRDTDHRQHSPRAAPAGAHKKRSAATSLYNQPHRTDWFCTLTPGQSRPATSLRLKPDSSPVRHSVSG